MWLPFIPYLKHSKYNGWIIVSKGEVWVGGVRQTSKNYPYLWGDALKRSGELLTANVKNVLMLGLAGGGALEPIYKAYPGCGITVLEQDPVMVDIAKELKHYLPYSFPRVYVGDAKESLKTLDRKFEVIAVDIFNGIIPSPLIDQEDFWNLIKARLAPGGVVVLNVAGSPTRMQTGIAHFNRFESWYCGANVFCALSD